MFHFVLDVLENGVNVGEVSDAPGVGMTQLHLGLSSCRSNGLFRRSEAAPAPGALWSRSHLTDLIRGGGSEQR